MYYFTLALFCLHFCRYNVIVFCYGSDACTQFIRNDITYRIFRSFSIPKFSTHVYWDNILVYYQIGALIILSCSCAGKETVYWELN